MKINWTLFYSYLVVWIAAGAVVFDAIIPMIIFTICGGVCGGLVLATEKRKEKVCN